MSKEKDVYLIPGSFFLDKENIGKEFLLPNGDSFVVGKPTQNRRKPGVLTEVVG